MSHCCGVRDEIRVARDECLNAHRLVLCWHEEAEASAMRQHDSQNAMLDKAEGISPASCLMHNSSGTHDECISLVGYPTLMDFRSVR